MNILEKIGSKATFSFVLMMALILLFDGAGGDHIHSIIMMVVISCLLFPDFIKNKFTFWILCSVQAINVYIMYNYTDNHKFLILYLFILLAILNQARSENEVLDSNYNELSSTPARLLISLVMIFACYWKYESKQYLSGDFFVYELIFDERFSRVKHIFSFLGLDVSYFNLAKDNFDLLATSHFYQKDFLKDVPFYYPAYLKTVAVIITYFGIIIEFLIGIFFMTSIVSKKFLTPASILLLIFCITVYLLAPVYHFAWTLMILNILALNKENLKLKGASVLIFYLVIIYKMIAQLTLTRFS